MGFSRFSTANANYELYYAVHTEPTIINQERFNSLDCTILETGDWNHRDAVFGRDRLLHEEQVQYGPVISQHKKSRKPIFLTDTLYFSSGVTKYNEKLKALSIAIPSTASLSLCFFLLPASVALTSYSYLNIYFNFFESGWYLKDKDLFKSKIKKIHNFFKEVNFFYSPHILRDAVTAKKTEEFIAPEMQKRLGRKPEIGIVFGAYHSGMELSLKYKKLREGIIKFHSALNYPCLDKSHLNKVSELNFEPLDDKVNRTILKEYSVNLFPV